VQTIELVEALVRVARGDRAAVEVDVGDRRLHPHVEPVLDVALDGREEQALELSISRAVHERDAARRVRRCPGNSGDSVTVMSGS
jgi:hypothetical protein